MAIKRSADELDNAHTRIHRRDAKRTKLSPSTERRSDSSVPSSGSVSEDSALQSSPPASDHTRKTSISSMQSHQSHDDCESSPDSSQSTSDSISEQEDDEELITIGGPKKPRIAHASVTEGAQDLRTRLEALLPQMAASNELLLSSEGGANIEDVKEGERHIEMNLGLGVLEEKRDHDSRSPSESTDVSDWEEDLVGDLPIPSSAVEQPQEERERDVMSRLLGRSRGRQNPGIEDLEMGSFVMR